MHTLFGPQFWGREVANFVRISGNLWALLLVSNMGQTKRNSPRAANNQQKTDRKRSRHPDGPRYSQTLVGVPKCSQMLPDTPRYSQILPDAPRYSQMPPDIPRWSEILRDTPRYPQMFPNAPRYSQIFPDSPRSSNLSFQT